MRIKKRRELVLVKGKIKKKRKHKKKAIDFENQITQPEPISTLMKKTNPMCNL